MNIMKFHAPTCRSMHMYALMVIQFVKTTVICMYKYLSTEAKRQQGHSNSQWRSDCMVRLGFNLTTFFTLNVKQFCLAM